MRNSTEADTSFIAALSEHGLILVEIERGHPELTRIFLHVGAERIAQHSSLAV